MMPRREFLILPDSAPPPVSARDAWLMHEDEVLTVLRDRGLQPSWGFPPPNDPPLRHRGSQAEYVLRYSHDGKLVLVQFTAPHRFTSIHFHPRGVSEEYVAIAGRLYNNSVVVPKNGSIVNEGVIHQAWTGDSSALTVIIMRGVDGFSEDQLHIRLHPQLERLWLGRSAFGPEFQSVHERLLLPVSTQTE